MDFLDCLQHTRTVLVSFWDDYKEWKREQRRFEAASRIMAALQVHGGIGDALSPAGNAQLAVTGADALLAELARTAKAEPDTFASLSNEILDWQAATFPHRTPHSITEHLRREAVELAAKPDDASELADVGLLLIAAADASGVDLIAAMRAKLERNKARKWGVPDAHGVVSHVSEAPDPGAFLSAAEDAELVALSHAIQKEHSDASSFAPLPIGANYGGTAIKRSGTFGDSVYECIDGNTITKNEARALLRRVQRQRMEAVEAGRRG